MNPKFFLSSVITIFQNKSTYVDSGKHMLKPNSLVVRVRDTLYFNMDPDQITTKQEVDG